MRKITMMVTICLGVVLSLNNISDAGDYRFEAANQFPQFCITADGLSVWGSAVENATGFKSLSVLETDIPYDTIRAWYATMLAAKIADRTIRVLFDDNSGKITRVIPW